MNRVGADRISIAMEAMTQAPKASMPSASQSAC
jgi:hypothetical protein